MNINRTRAVGGSEQREKSFKGQKCVKTDHYMSRFRNNFKLNSDLKEIPVRSISESGCWKSSADQA